MRTWRLPQTNGDRLTLKSWIKIYKKSFILFLYNLKKNLSCNKLILSVFALFLKTSSKTGFKLVLTILKWTGYFWNRWNRFHRFGTGVLKIHRSLIPNLNFWKITFYIFLGNRKCFQLNEWNSTFNSRLWLLGRSNRKSSCKRKWKRRFKWKLKFCSARWNIFQFLFSCCAWPGFIFSINLKFFKIFLTY